MSDTTENPPAEPVRCDHVWVSHHEPGHCLYWVRQCMVCHDVDWNDLDKQIRALVEPPHQHLFKGVMPGGPMTCACGAVMGNQGVTFTGDDHA